MFSKCCGLPCYPEHKWLYASFGDSDKRLRSSRLADLCVVSANEGVIQNAIGDKIFAKPEVANCMQTMMVPANRENLYPLLSDQCRKCRGKNIQLALD